MQIVNKNTILGISYLKNATVGSSTFTISGSTIGSLFFSQNMIEFDSLNPSKLKL
jgi:hypothetical protein